MIGVEFKMMGLETRVSIKVGDPLVGLIMDESGRKVYKRVEGFVDTIGVNNSLRGPFMFLLADKQGNHLGWFDQQYIEVEEVIERS
jgi:hypothetical protein